MRTVVVLPTYNEAGNILSMLDRVLASEIHPNVLVVDDSSPDGTGPLVSEYAKANPGRVELLTRTAKEGLGAAYRAGFAHALHGGAQRIVQMDADGSHPVEALARMAAAMDAGADLVIGSRYVKGGKLADEWPTHRKALSRCGNWYARTVLRMPQIRDLTGGFKMWNADLLRRMNFGDANAAGYAFQIQTTLAAAAADAVIAEIPIVFSERESGVSKMSGSIVGEAARSVLRMRAQAHALTPKMLTAGTRP